MAFQIPGGHAAAIDTLVHVTLRQNGDFDGATDKRYSLSPSDTDLSQFLSDASKAADVYPDAATAFNAYGDEILNCLLIEDNDVIFLVRPGETFVKPKATDGASLPKQVGRFTVGEPLGTDRMGMRVTLGEDPSTKERIVLKFMSRRSIRSVEQSDKIQNEVRVWPACKKWQFSQCSTDPGASSLAFAGGLFAQALTPQRFEDAVGTHSPFSPPLPPSLPPSAYHRPSLMHPMIPFLFNSAPARGKPRICHLGIRASRGRGHATVHDRAGSAHGGGRGQSRRAQPHLRGGVHTHAAHYSQGHKTRQNRHQDQERLHQCAAVGVPRERVRADDRRRAQGAGPRVTAVPASGGHERLHARARGRQPHGRDLREGPYQRPSAGRVVARGRVLRPGDRSVAVWRPATVRLHAAVDEHQERHQVRFRRIPLLGAACSSSHPGPAAPAACAATTSSIVSTAWTRTCRTRRSNSSPACCTQTQRSASG